MALTFEEYVSGRRRNEQTAGAGKLSFDDYVKMTPQQTAPQNDALMDLAMETVQSKMHNDNHDVLHGVFTPKTAPAISGDIAAPVGKVADLLSIPSGNVSELPKLISAGVQALKNPESAGDYFGITQKTEPVNQNPAADFYLRQKQNQQAEEIKKQQDALITQIKVIDRKRDAAKREANSGTTMQQRANLSGLANTAARENAQAYMEDRYANLRELDRQRAELIDQLHAIGGKYGVGDFVGDFLDSFQAASQTPLATLDKTDYWASVNAGLISPEDQAAYDRAHALENDIAQQTAAAKSGRGKAGQVAMDAAAAAGNVLGSTAFAYATGIPQAAQQFLGPVAANLSATEAQLGAKAGERVAAGAQRFAGNLIGDIVANPTNFAISAQSGIGAYDRAKTAGASETAAFAAAIGNAAAEYFSNKMFSGTPLLDSPEEKGYVVELIEAAAEKAGRSGQVQALFNNGLVSYVFDKSGEGLEEVITGVLDPLIERLTYNPDADRATAEELFNEFIGGVAMSLLLGATEPVTNFQGRKAEARANEAAAAAYNAATGGASLESAARELQRQGNTQTVEDLRPAYEAGTRALGKAAKLTGVDTEGKTGMEIRRDVDAAVEAKKNAPLSDAEILNMALSENNKLSDEGKAVARDMFRLTRSEETSPLEFMTGFNAVYEAAQRGESPESVKSEAAARLTPQARAAAYDAGLEAMRADTAERYSYSVRENDGEYTVVIHDAETGRDNPMQSVSTREEAEAIVNNFKGVTESVESGNQGEIRDAGVPGREGRGGLRERAEKNRTWRETRKRDAEGIRNRVEAAGDGEKVSAREAGISGGTDAKTMSIVRTYRDADMRKMESEAAAHGVKVVFFSGEIEARKGGETIKARGEYSADGKTFYVAVDDPDFTARQIFDHEDFHARAHTDAELQQICEDIINGHSAAELQELVNAYVNTYGWTSMSDEDILQEILADAYAGIDVFQYLYSFEGATQFTEDVRGAVKARESEQRTERGPPAGAKLSQKMESEENVAKLTPANVDNTTLPPNVEVLFSQKYDAEYMQNAEDFNKKSRIVPESVLRNARKAREIAKKKLEAIKDLLPPDIEGNTWYDDSSYGGTQENTTICPRSLALEELMDAVAEELGRPLTVEDTVFIAQEAMAYTDKPECLYCYVAMDRKAYRDALGKYIDQRDAFLKDVADGMEIGLVAPTAKGAGSRKVSKDSAYGRFLNGRANTENMYKRAQLWLNTENAITKQDVASAARMNAALNDPTLREQILDVMDYAQKATWAKKKVGYTAYDNGILKWSDERVRDLNRMYGMRMYSFSDFSPAFILENMQMITDASVRGLKALGYTKELDFVRIFAPSGININISVFGYNDWNTGKVAMDAMQGADWNEAKALRAQYPNVGCTFVATNDAQVEWALAQDWIDVVIPYHIVRTGANVAKMFGWENYQRMQEDKKNPDWIAGDSTHIYPYQHQNNKATYLRLCKQNHLTPRFSKWVGNPNYMKLVNETRQSDKQTKPVKPIFNTEFIDASIDEMVKRGGYVQHIGGTVENMQDIASETAEKIRSGKSAIRTEAKLSQKITPQQDADYSAAVERGDTEAAQRMVDEAAKNAGYDIKVYRGGGQKHNVFDTKRGAGDTQFGPGTYFTDAYGLAQDWAKERAHTSDDNGYVGEYYIKARNLFSDDSTDFNTEQWENVERALRDRGVSERELKRIRRWGFYGIAQALQSVGEIEEGSFTPYSWRNAPKVNQILREAGYDGIEAPFYDSRQYVIFDPTQVKSADPVTYDDNGNIIPLSERFNPENQDIRFSQKLTAEDELRQQNDELQKLVDYWRGQTKRTTAPAVRADDAEKVARDFVKSYNSKLDVKDAAAAVKALAEYIQSENVTWAEVKDRAYGIARDVVENAETLREGDGATYDEVKTALKKPLIISAQDAHDISSEWGAWRNANVGKVNVSINGKGTPVDVAYAELSERFPSLFPESITHPADQVQQMVDVVNELAPVYENPFSYNMAEAIEYCANDLISRVYGENIRMAPPTFADRAAARLEAEKARGAEKTARVREQKNAEIADLKARNAWATARRIAEVRKQRDAKIAALKEHYAESRKAASERRADSAARTRLLKIIRRLNNKKLPAVNRAWLEEKIGDLDTVAKSITGETIKDLTRLRSWYDNQKANNPDFIADAATEAKIARLSQTRISDLTLSQVQELTEVLLNFENEIANQRKLIDSLDMRDTRQMVLESLYNVEETKGSQKTAADWIVTNTLSPERLVKRLTGYAETDPLLMRTRDLADGQRKMLDYQMRAEAKFKRWANDKKLMERLRSKERIKITGYYNGRAVDVEITPDMRMALYLHSLNDQNMKHIANGGVTIPDIGTYLKGDIGEAYSRGTTVKLSPSNIRSIASGMSAEERAFARAAHDYFNGMSRDEINAVSEKLVGYSIAGVEDYFPIETDRNFTKSDIAELKRDGTIEGMGFLKERKPASNAIDLVPLTDVLNKSIKNHAKYVGLAIPVRNFSKVWGMNAHNDAASEDNGLRKAIGKKWGERGVDAIETMIADLQNSYHKADELDKMFSKVKSNYAGAVLTLNLSVAMKQAASYPTAAAVLGWGPVAKAMKDVGRVNLDQIAKFTPLQWYRSQGYSTQELGDIRTRGGLMDRVLGTTVRVKGRDVPLFNWIQTADLLTTRKLWKASEYYVQQHNADLRRGSEEYYTAVADIYNRVIEETQPNYTTMQRPQLLRSHSAWAEILGMFKTQPFQNFNILYDATAELAAAERAAKNGDKSRLAAARRNAKNAYTSQIASLALFAAMTAAYGFLRGRDDKWRNKEGEVTVGSVAAGIGRDMIGGLFSMVPGGSDVYNLGEAMATGGKYYGVSSVTVSALTDAGTAIYKAGTAISKAIEQANDPEKEVDVKALSKSMETLTLELSKALGVPAENIRNDVQIIMKIALNGAFGYYVGSYIMTRYTENMDSSYTKGDVYDLLYSAYRHDRSAYNELRRMMKEDGFTDKNMDAAIKKRSEKK